MADDVVQTSIEGFVDLTKVLLHELQDMSDERLAASCRYRISDESASQVIRACFYASMTSDEGKWPKVTLQASVVDDSSDRMASFDPPVACDASSIAKLSHAVDNWCSLGFAELNGVPMIVGILPSVSVLLGTFVTQRAVSLSSLKVAIRHPGNIDMICKKGVLSFKAGVVSQYQSILSSKALQRLAAIMDDRVNLLLGHEHESKPHERMERCFDDAPYDDYADSKAQLVISELVWRISDIGSGGILIITKQAEHESLFYKYRTNAGSLQDAVVRYWRAAYEDRCGPASVPSSLSPSSTLIHEGVKLRECVAATAQFAGTDGAIVLGTDFSLHGFGAIIGRTAVDESKVSFVDGVGSPITYSSIVQSKGSRHQAALSFAIREDGVVVFVVSQDGHVTVFENQGGVVRVETGLRADGV